MAKKLLSLVPAISGLASLASAFVPEAKSNIAVYYGQGLAQPRLAEFCQDTTFDIINIGFINTFPDQDPLTGLPGSNFGNQCWADTYVVDGVPSKLYSQCPNLVEDIPACQAAGKKIFLSLGGGHNTYEIDTIDASTKFADWLWGAFGPKTDAWESAGSPRPFGDAVVDGFDFDIEYNGSWGYANMIKRLRRRFEEAPDRRFYISAAPQCPIPDEQLGVAIANSAIDFVWVQFYNSNPCSARDFVAGTKNGFNFDEWVQVIKNGANPNAKLYVGLPASVLAANLGYYLTPEEVQPLVEKYMNKYPETFGGIMLWEATESMRNQIDGVSYGEKMKDILYDLDPNHPTPTPSPSPTPTPTPTSTTTTTTTTSTSFISSIVSTTSTPSTTIPTPTPSGNLPESSTSTSTKTASTSETSNTPPVTPSWSSTFVSSSTHVPTSTPSVSASSSVVSSSTSVSVTSSSIPSSSHTSTSTPSIPVSSSVASSSATASSTPVVLGTRTSSPVSHSTPSTSIPSSTPGAYSPSAPGTSSTSLATTDCSESSTATSTHSMSSTPRVSKTPSASSPVISPSSSISTETTVTLTVFPTPSSSRVPTSISSVPISSTETESTSSATSQTSSTSTSRPVIPTTSSSSRSTASTSRTVTPTPGVPGVPTSSSSKTTSSSQTTDSDCNETATATSPTKSTTNPTTELTTEPTDTGSVTIQPTTTVLATTTTIIVTSYTSICPTGFTTITTTFTSTYCPGAAPASSVATDIPGSVQPTGTPDIPEGWTTIVTVCNVCAATPTMVTLTLPPATTTGESTPAQPTDISTEVPSDDGYMTIPSPAFKTEESHPVQPTGNSSAGGANSGEGYTTITRPGSTTTVVVVPAHPASTSKHAIGSISSTYLSSTFYVQPSASRAPVAPSGTQGGETPVFTGAASRASGLAKGASMLIAGALSVLVVM